MDVRMNDGTILTMSPGFKVGDPAPRGYLDWQEWAGVQHKGRLRQRQCCRCSLWHYPQEQAFIDTMFQALTSQGKPVAMREAVCLSCAAISPSSEATTNAR